MNSKAMAVSRKKIGEFVRSLVGKNAWVLFIFVAAVVALGDIFLSHRLNFSSYVSGRFASQVDRRFDKLEGYMSEALSETGRKWLDIEDLPEDMVIYRYVGDSLQSWCNQFTLDNDDISGRVVFRRFTSLRYNFVSPLTEADTSVKYMNIGPKWYLVKMLKGYGNVTIIGGLEIRNTLDSRSVNGVNPRFHLSDRFSVQPISYSCGCPISVDGYPLMKIIQETTKSNSPFYLPDTVMLWIIVALLVMVVLGYLHFHRTRRGLWIAMGIFTVMMLVFYLLGYSMQGSSSLFSPTVYADGLVFYSLGSVLIVNLWLMLLFYSVYMARGSFLQNIFIGGVCSWRGKVLVGGVLAATVLVLCYMTYTLRSLILNSNISFELYKITQLGRYTLYVYLSYLALASTIPLMLQVIRLPVFSLFKIKYNVFSRWGRVIYAFTCAACFICIFSVLGNEKERSRVEIWMNRLSIDRNLGLELQLRDVERAIEEDNSIQEVMFNTGDYRVVLNRITETYMRRISKDYDVSLFLYRDKPADVQTLRFIDERIMHGTPIAADSRFCFSRNSNGRGQYAGLFVYYTQDKGTMNMLLGISSKSEREERGYSFILDAGAPGSVIVPPIYSYAKYVDSKLIASKGDYPYPTRLDDGSDSERLERVFDGSSDGYVHSFNNVSSDETIILSRPKFKVKHYAIAACTIWLIAYFWLSLLGMNRRKRAGFERNYYKSTVNAVLLVAMLLVLAAMSAIMVSLVYRRNDANAISLMTSKITTIRSLVENRVGSLRSYRDIPANDMSDLISGIGDYTRSDLTLYSPDGKVFNTTAPEVFENMVIGSRTDGEAYRNIVYDNKRYYIHREKLEDHSFYTMYAPILNENGDLLAILSAPYTDSGLSFKADALFYSAFVIVVFFFLLIVTRLLTSKVVEKIFRPVMEIGKKMNYARTDGLEYIIYDKNDELSGLVRAYNLMVHDLSESSKQVAQAERERAWSEMARQVAHEIKNPLTPMKLQIQRLIRLKSRNDPAWEAKFDDISRLILDSIEVLTDTANEFSTFAKLYMEDMVSINLDAIASDQVSMFDDKDNITFQYFGFKDSWVMGPKPQLVRVFVNLLTNAVQAIENKQKEDEEAGLEPVHGQILLAIRNSGKEGFYDIVVEDNGPGIKDENRSHLFTPNFTTKSSGTGLGLAICKNILERCGGEIFYSKSFSLGGACFTIRYPKKNGQTLS